MFMRSGLPVVKTFCIDALNEHMAYNAAHVPRSNLRGVIPSKKKATLHSFLRENLQVSLRGISITNSGILLFHFGPVTLNNTYSAVHTKQDCMQLAWLRPSLKRRG